MIITCPNCNKQFKIDNSLIPDEGRDLQCGSCNHIWFYNIQEKNNEVLELKQEIISEDIETKAENKEDKIEEKQQPEEIIKTEINNKKKQKNCRTVCPEYNEEKCVQPNCRTVCDKPECTVSCTTPKANCITQCEDPICKWNCQKPSSCPEPKCKLICEK